jgi:transcription initiation factor TFIID subunit 10
MSESISNTKSLEGSDPHNSVIMDIHEKSKLLELEEDKNMIELLSQLDDFTPIIPDELMDYFMVKSGLDSNDRKIKRLLALITQKYITDIAQDALQYCKLRTSSSTLSKDKKKDRKLILTVDDLSCAIEDYGIHVRKPPYYR